MDLKSVLALVLLLSPSVYGCVQFKASMDGNLQVNGVLNDNGVDVCSANGISTHPVVDFTCNQGYTATFNMGNVPAEAFVTYVTGWGTFTFSTNYAAGNNVWTACNYDCPPNTPTCA